MRTFYGIEITNRKKTCRTRGFITFSPPHTRALQLAHGRCLRNLKLHFVTGIKLIVVARSKNTQKILPLYALPPGRNRFTRSCYVPRPAKKITPSLFPPHASVGISFVFRIGILICYGTALDVRVSRTRQRQKKIKYPQTLLSLIWLSWCQIVSTAE